MITYENECCGCAVPAYPCMGDACPNRHVHDVCTLFFVKSLNGLNKVLSAFKTKKASKINGCRVLTPLRPL